MTVFLFQAMTNSVLSWFTAMPKGVEQPWQLQELAQTSLQITFGNDDQDGTVLAVNCDCFYTDDKGPLANPLGALWRIVAADKVPAAAEVAKTKSDGFGC